MNIAAVFFSMKIRLSPDLPKKTVFPREFGYVGFNFPASVFARHARRDARTSNS